MDYPYALESVCLAMSIQGSLSVRNGPNRHNTMNRFHSFVRSTLAAYAGATFTNVFMGRPTSMLSNDVFFGSCLLGYAIVNISPFDFGYRVFNDTFVGSLLVNVLSQVFRVSGIYGFSDAAHMAFKDNPSSYYPIPLFGPMLLPTMLGNMGGFLWNGFDGYLEGGTPWLFQQGMSCSAFYHLYAHDATGFLGTTLRYALRPIAIRVMAYANANGDDDVLFARVFIGTFMVLMSILHMPQFLGPKYSPFVTFYEFVARILGGGDGGKSRRRGRRIVASNSSRGGGGGEKKTNKKKKNQ